MCLLMLNGSISTIQSMLPSNKSSVEASYGIISLLVLFAPALHPVWANKTTWDGSPAPVSWPDNSFMRFMHC